MEPQAGTILAGKFRVEAVIGRGGMGVVVRAVQEPIGRRVAVKLLYAETVHDERARGRFVREAKAAAALTGDHVVQIFDYGTLDDGSPYLAMELLQGVDLATKIKRDGPLDPATAAAYALDACLALAQAHAHGVIHRDLKPANLFLVDAPGGGEPIVKVLDFGVAKSNVLGDGEASLTRSDAIVGTPQYMAPEQILSASDADARSDVWSLGASLQELVTGRPPFIADTVGKVVSKVLQDPAEPLPPSVPATFAAVVRRCLEKKPDARFADIAALARALEPFAPASFRGRSTSVARRLASTSSPSADSPVELAPSTRTDWGTQRASPSRRGLPMIAGGVFAVLLALALVARARWNRDPIDENRTEPPATIVTVPPASTFASSESAPPPALSSPPPIAPPSTTTVATASSTIKKPATKPVPSGIPSATNAPPSATATVEPKATVSAPVTTPSIDPNLQGL
jgi:serine/threonine protein kinase